MSASTSGIEMIPERAVRLELAPSVLARGLGDHDQELGGVVADPAVDHHPAGTALRGAFRERERLVDAAPVDELLGGVGQELEAVQPRR
jgi:hypothetical protein